LSFIRRSIVNGCGAIVFVLGHCTPFNEIYLPKYLIFELKILLGEMVQTTG